ncbi:MAG: hypothetical protein ACRC1W_01540 [Shewanella sp.]
MNNNHAVINKLQLTIQGAIEDSSLFAVLDDIAGILAVMAIERKECGDSEAAQIFHAAYRGVRQTCESVRAS